MRSGQARLWDDLGTPERLEADAGQSTSMAGAQAAVTTGQGTASGRCIASGIVWSGPANESPWPGMHKWIVDGSCPEGRSLSEVMQWCHDCWHPANLHPGVSGGEWDRGLMAEAASIYAYMFKSACERSARGASALGLRQRIPQHSNHLKQVPSTSFAGF